jgi:hypothetical protein
VTGAQGTDQRDVRVADHVPSRPMKETVPARVSSRVAWYVAGRPSPHASPSHVTVNEIAGQVNKQLQRMELRAAGVGGPGPRGLSVFLSSGDRAGAGRQDAGPARPARRAGAPRRPRPRGGGGGRAPGDARAAPPDRYDGGPTVSAIAPLWAKSGHVYFGGNRTFAFGAYTTPSDIGRICQLPRLVLTIGPDAAPTRLPAT